MSQTGFTASLYGDFNNPQQIVSGGGQSPFIQAQWWEDFSLLTGPNLSCFFGIESSIGSSGQRGIVNFGVFFLPDGDVNPDDLFNVIIPDILLEVDGVAASVTPFGGHDFTVVIPNPGGQKQVLFACTVSHATSQSSTITLKYRSVVIDVKSVGP